MVRKGRCAETNQRCIDISCCKVAFVDLSLCKNIYVTGSEKTSNFKKLSKLRRSAKATVWES